ncbi:hypothetical protein EC912_104311 [Luteibacter rhizovicinus]|uniref:Uncharacterized protein n=1 Tax=Luteibacter rhizovicinus TaxID=242606 RepID=A0A4R3YS66_9GAMM|nr:hypothetical protein [Luteibacter rhizovicinus]TCV94114.1 hypothetical protein EC912_104311 [Luteibacter rhizovicinus]
MRYTVALTGLMFLSIDASGFATPPDIGSTVDRLVEDTTKSSEAERHAFAQLIDLGSPAVPYIIGHLGDGRPLAEQIIQRDQWHQEHVWYVHDGLLAVLRQTVGHGMGATDGHASASQRAAIKRKWENWCVEKYPDQSHVCRGGHDG